MYAWCKANDGIRGEGTTLNMAIEAAVSLGWIERPRDIMTVSNRAELKIALRRYRHVLAGFDVDSSLSSVGHDGMWHGNGTGNDGHAMLICGMADDAEQWVAEQQSWGVDGYGWSGFVRESFEVFDKRYMYGMAFDVKPLR
jgi:hypothetical protein